MSKKRLACAILELFNKKLILKWWRKKINAINGVTGCLFWVSNRQQLMRVGKVPGETERSSKQTEGNHDNLVSGTHQAPSH